MHTFRFTRPQFFHRFALVSLASVGLFAAMPFALGQGIVESWGTNFYGELGTGSNAQSVSTPTVLDGLPGGVTAVAVGAGYSVAIRNGAVYAWGDNSMGEFGDGTTASSRTPVPVANLSSGVTALAGGTYHCLAIRDGGAYAWGSNASGELGNGNSYPYQSGVPVPVTGLSSRVTAISGGFYHSLAVKDGAAYAWGYNSDGQLGNNSTTSSNVPVPVAILSNDVTAVAAGANYSLAISNGAAYAWGNNVDGELGNGSTTSSNVPMPVYGLFRGVTSIAAGGNHCLAVQDGNVFAWGYNGSGQLGDGNSGLSLHRDIPSQVDPANLRNIVAVSAGSRSSYALSSDGSLWVWGGNDSGQLGLGNEVEYLTPQHLLPPTGYYYSSLDAGEIGNHVVAVLSPVTPPFFSGEVALDNNVHYLQLPNGNAFGYYAYLDNPRYLYHFDLGYEYVFDAVDGHGGVYLYDFRSSTFFYTSLTFPFPYLYDFKLNTILYYYPNPDEAGRYNTNGVRYFYDFASGRTIIK